MAVKRHNVNFDITAQDSSAGVFATVEKNLKSVKDAGMDLQKRLTMGFGAVAAAVEGFQLAHALREILGANAAMDDFAEETGSSVENLSALMRVAKVAGRDFGIVTEAMGKAVKGLKGFDEEGQNAAAALAYIGVSAKNADGTLRDQGEVMIDVAKKLATFADNGNKVALVQDIYGKGAQKLLPYLKDLADETDRHATLTSKQAAMAEEAEKNMRRLNLTIEDGRRELVNNYTPALNDFLEKLMAATKAKGGSLAGGIGLMLMQPLGKEDIGARLNEINADIAEREKSMRGRFANVPLIGANNAYSGTRLQMQYQQRDYLLFLQRQEALANAGGDASLDARDLRLRHKGTLDYQTPPKPRDKSTLTSYEAAVLQMRQQSLKEQTGSSEFVETSLAIKAGKFTQFDDKTGKARALTDAEKQLLLALAADRDMQRQLREDREAMTKANEEAIKASDELYAKLVQEASALKDLIEPGRQYLKDKEKADELVRRGLLTQDEAVAVQRKQLEARTKVDEVAQKADVAGDAAHSLGLSFTSAFDRIVSGSERSIRALDLVYAAALDVAKVVFSRMVTDPLAAGVTSGLKGGFQELFGSKSTGTGMTNDFAIPFAKGGVFSGGRVTAFAGGGIVTKPAIFPMAGGAGLMGERGEEAIMPLRRGSDGKLGVLARAGGGEGATIVVHQSMNFALGVGADVRNEIAAQLPRIAEAAKAAVYDAQRRGVRA